MTVGVVFLSCMALVGILLILWPGWFIFWVRFTEFFWTPPIFKRHAKSLLRIGGVIWVAFAVISFIKLLQSP